jgi:hypothetical protein
MLHKLHKLHNDKPERVVTVDQNTQKPSSILKR